MSQEEGKENEAKVVQYYKDQGYTVLNQNDAGFPDLLIFEDGKLFKLVEVKGGGHDVHEHQLEYLRSLARLGFEVEVIRVLDDELKTEMYFIAE